MYKPNNTGKIIQAKPKDRHTKKQVEHKTKNQNSKNTINGLASQVRTH